ncbi:MAG: PQQ-binding-like beta-propeller repeat protein [Planctomycetota bacterium]
MRIFYYTILILLFLIIGIGLSQVVSSNTYTEIEPSRAYIRVSNEAENLIKAARKAETEQQWIIAVKNYHKAIELYPQYVINQSIFNNTIDNKNNDIYWGVQYICEKSLQDLPPDGKKIYREIFEPVAKHIFEQGCKADPTTSRLEVIDINKLFLLANQYSLTYHGQMSLIILMRWYFEQAELYKAIKYYRKLSGTFPEIAESLPEAKKINVFLNNKGITESKSWQTYAGNNTHSQIMSIQEPKEILSSLFGFFALPTQLVKLRQIPITMGYYNIMPVESIPYFPVVSNGLVYLSTGLGIYVLELEPKEIKAVDKTSSAEEDNPYKLKEKWKFEIPLDENTQIFPEERIINTATISNNNHKLYVPLITAFEKHERKLGYLDVKYPFPRRTLFAFDTLTGRILWTTRKVPYDNKDNNSFEDILFPVAPAAEDDVLYLAGIHMLQQTDIPEHYLFALNGKNGEVYFKTFIASGILETNLFNNPSREPIVSAVTVDKDNIYYCSDMGVISAVDKYSGMLKWLKKYEQYSIPSTYPAINPPRLPLRWVNNPIIYTDSLPTNKTKGQIIITAIDSPFLYVLSTENGEELWRWNADAVQMGNIRYLVGIKDNLLIVSGESSLICLNLAKDGKIEWIKDGYKFMGKGAITDDKIYVSTTDKGILEIGLKTGKLLNIHTALPEEKIYPAGHLLLVNNFLITASSEQINIYKTSQATKSIR